MSFRRVAAMASAACVASAAESGTIKLDWSDCADSSTHGHITSLSPDTVVLGTKTSLAGKGTVDEAITGATYKVVAKALGITVFSHTGDACKPETIQLPAGTGNITMKGFSCPIQAGPVELDLDLSLSASIPASLARTTIDLTASATSGDKALCVQIKTSKATTEDPVDPVKPGVNYAMKWASFKEEYGKTYSSAVEEEQRFQIFKVNVDYIDLMNSMNNAFELGVTPFADLTADEFGASHFGIAKPDALWASLPNLGNHTYNGEELAASVDWTTKGAVTPVKNQGQCGSCWSFSTTGSLEGAWEIASGKLVSLSEQQFVDCDKADSGCNGGLMDTAFKYAEKNALCTEGSYPYKAKGGTCKASSCTTGIPKGGVTGYKNVGADSEQALMSALNQQPVSIAIEADKSVFQLYKSGVLSGTCGTSLDHGVLAVGYGTESGKDYWLVKNSWGKSWGSTGYVKLLRGKGGAGECGLLKEASYPVVKASSSVVV